MRHQTDQSPSQLFLAEEEQRKVTACRNHPLKIMLSCFVCCVPDSPTSYKSAELSACTGLKSAMQRTHTHLQKSPVNTGSSREEKLQLQSNRGSPPAITSFFPTLRIIPLLSLLEQVCFHYSVLPHNLYTDSRQFLLSTLTAHGFLFQIESTLSTTYQHGLQDEGFSHVLLTSQGIPSGLKHLCSMRKQQVN